MKNKLYGVISKIGSSLIVRFVAIFVFGFISGIIICIYSLPREILLPAMATLVAAFLGAGAAFVLEATRRNAERLERDLESANRLLYALYERLNTLKLFQIDFIEPVRHSPGRMLEMQPVLDLRESCSVFNVEILLFILNTKYKDLILDLHVLNENYFEAVKQIRYRSNLHLNIIQPLLSERGYKSGELIRIDEIKKIIDDRNYHLLQQATESVIGTVDNFIQKGDSIRGRLIEAFSDIFPANKVFNYELLDDPRNI